MVGLNGMPRRVLNSERSIVETLLSSFSTSFISVANRTAPAIEVIEEEEEEEGGRRRLFSSFLLSEKSTMMKDI